MHITEHAHHCTYTPLHIHNVAHAHHGPCTIWTIWHMHATVHVQGPSADPAEELSQPPTTDSDSWGEVCCLPLSPQCPETIRHSWESSQAGIHFFFLTIYNLWSKTSWISEEIEGELTNIISSYITWAKAAIDPNGDHEGIRCLCHLTASLTPNIFL